MNRLYLKRTSVLLAVLVSGLTLVLSANLAVRSNNASAASVLTTPMPTQTQAPYEPTLYISFREGAPGSIFTLTGLGFHDVPNDPVTITVNGQYVGTISGSSGWFVFLLDTTNADEGLYIVVVQTPGVTTSEYFRLDANEPLRQPINTGPTFMIPAGIAFISQQFLPAVMK